MASTFLSLSPETTDTLMRLSQEADVTRYLSGMSNILPDSTATLNVVLCSCGFDYPSL